MTAAFTLILPHKTNPGNDAALKVCLDCLIDNTCHEFHLLMDATLNEPLYPRVNRMIEQADTECVIYWSSDMFASPGWDIPVMEKWNPDTIVTFALVEPGMIGIAPENILRDFGRTPETFDRDAFEDWCISATRALGISPCGWYAPVAYPRTKFLELGGLQSNTWTDHQGFSQGDIALFEAWEAHHWPIVRARSFVYHLQRYSEIDEQNRPERR